MFKRREKVYCGNCEYFKDGRVWHERKCLTNSTIRIEHTYRERTEYECFEFPQTKNSNNNCKDYKEKK